MFSIKAILTLSVMLGGVPANTQHYILIDPFSQENCQEIIRQVRLNIGANDLLRLEKLDCVETKVD